MLDDLILALQRLIDRLVRRLRLGPAPAPTRPRLLVVQIDGLSRVVLERGVRLRPRAVPRAPPQAPRLRARAHVGGPAHLDAGIPDGGDVRGASRHPGLPLLRSRMAGRHPLPARWARGARRGAPHRRPPGDPARRQRLRLRLHRGRREQPVQLHHVDAAHRPRVALRAVARGGRGVGDRQERGPHRGRAGPRPAPLRRGPRAAAARLALAHHQDRPVGVGARAVHARRLPGPLRGDARGVRELPRLRRGRARVRPAEPPRDGRAPARGWRHPPDRPRDPPRARVPVRPLRARRPRAGALPPVPRRHRRPAARALGRSTSSSRRPRPPRPRRAARAWSRASGAAAARRAGSSSAS